MTLTPQERTEHPYDKPGPHLFETRFGKMRLVIRDDKRVWVLKCPGCGTWCGMDDDMLHGRVSVLHENCSGNYHETHNFNAGLPSEERDLNDLQDGAGYG